MRLPFFRSSKVESAKTVVVPRPRIEPAKTVAAPPRPSPRTNTKLQLAETQLMSNPVNGAPPSSTPSTSTPDNGRRASATNGQTIPLSLSAISQQLPANFLAAVAPENLSRVTINIPADWVLPQLANGRVTITLADLLPLLPENIAHRQFPTGNSQHAIVLPLAEMVSALPMDLLQHQNQTAIDLDTPEFTQFPKLIDDSGETPVVEQTAGTEETVAAVPPPAPEVDVYARSAEPTPTSSAVSTPTTEETSFPRPLSGNMAKPIPAAVEPVTQPAAPRTPTNDNEITVSLRSLVAVMPDQYFVCARTDLWRRIDLDTRIALPADLVVPQLKIARVRLPMGVAVGLMPRSILASPLPSISDETIPIALQEIVAQLPSRLFASQSQVSDLQEIDFSDSEIPTPFAEKNFASTTVEIRAPETAWPVPASATSQPETAPEPIEVSSGALDDGLSIFGEKPAVAESATVESAPTSEADVEAPATTEPTTVEPVAEVATSVPAVSEEPVITEPPVEARSEESAPVDQASIESVADVAEPIPAVTEPPVPVKPEPVEAAAEVAAPTPVTTEEPTIAETPHTDEAPAALVEAAEVAPVAETETPPDSPAPAAETPSPAAPEFATEPQAPEPTVLTPSAGTTPDQFLTNLNNCTLADLARIEGIGPVLAQRIIGFRNEHGGFKSLDELHGIPGVGRKLHRLLAGPGRRGLNRLLGVEHNEELTLQEVVRLTSQLKGVAGCILAMSDGVFLTGQLPPHLDQETISVFAPQLFRKVGRYMKELRAGQVTRLSVFTDQQPISILRAGDIFLIVVHDNRHFSKALLRRCERISQELARLCRQRAVV